MPETISYFPDIWQKHLPFSMVLIRHTPFQSLLFSCSPLLLMMLCACQLPDMDIRTVSTYESISLAWSPVEGRPDRICKVDFRKKGTQEWEEGFPLWFDNRDWEYRGSLVELDPGTSYEIRLQLEGLGVEQRSTAKTWTENVRIADTVFVSSRNKTLIARKGGSPEKGYVLYMPKPGDSAVIDVKKQYELCVKIKRSYIIVRGFTLRGATEHGVRINPRQHHIIIEQCDIADWGSPEPGYEAFGQSQHAGIFTDGDGFHPYHVVIQDNKIHHPTYGANYPGQAGAKGSGSRGPKAISLMRGGGVYVIRHNAIYSDSAHYFSDGMGEWRNFSFQGFPSRESDIHHNYISHCWGDAIEAEGGNQNVRIWANYSTHCTYHISTANTNLGPLYIWRNISGISALKPGEYGTEWGLMYDKDHPDPSEEVPRGIIYLFHNTLSQPIYQGLPAGATLPKLHDRVIAKNNIFPDSDSNNRVDQGEFLIGFNDHFVGKGPDIGAIEEGKAEIHYGPRKDRLYPFHINQTDSLSYISRN